MTKNELFSLNADSYITIDGKVYKYYSTRRAFNMLYFVFIDEIKNKIIISFNDANEFHSICYNETLTTYSLDFVLPASEKEVLEIELKDAEEQVQKETARVDSIKAKLEELSKPKLKIGGLYKFKFNGNPNSTLGVLYCHEAVLFPGIYKFITPRFNILVFDFNTKNGIDFNAIKKSEFKEITNPKYSHIGKTIIEFHALSQKNF